MTVVRTALLLLPLVLAIGGCRRDEPAESTGAASTAATTPGAQTPPAEATTPPTVATDATNTPPAATEPNAPVTSNGADLNLAQSAEHGRYLVDATGKALYMLEKDSSGTSTCHGACATEWPPLLAEQGTPRTLDPSLDAGAVGVIQRNDGTQQVTFNGHPLYHFTQDTAAGQINGAGREDPFGEWYLLGADGNPLRRR